MRALFTSTYLCIPLIYFLFYFYSILILYLITTIFYRIGILCFICIIFTSIFSTVFIFFPVVGCLCNLADNEIEDLLNLNLDSDFSNHDIINNLFESSENENDEVIPNVGPYGDNSTVYEDINFSWNEVDKFISQS